MKKLLLLSLLILFSSTAYCQSFSLANVPDQSYSSPNFSNPPNHNRRMCAVTKVGLVATGVGLAAMVAGIAMGGLAMGGGSQDNKPTNQDVGGSYILAGGFGLFLTGGCLAVGGGIHDIVNYHKHRLSLIAPKRNQLGLAYNLN